MSVVETPSDFTFTTRDIVEKAAKFVAKQGLVMEKKMIQCLGNKGRYDFLNHPTSPPYLYYKEKLAQYLTQKDDDDDDEHFDAKNITEAAIFDQPSSISVGTLVERTALLVALKGSGFATTVIKRTANDPRFGFLRSSEDPLYNYYMLRLAEHCYDLQGGGIEAFEREAKIAHSQQPSFQSRILPLPDFLHFRLPRGMTMEEVNLVKATAQFGAWYGVEFLLELTERVMKKTDNTPFRFEFMEPINSSFPFYNELMVGFTEVMTPPQGLREKLREDHGYVAAIVDGFFERIRWDRVQEMYWMHEGQNAMADWHDSVTKAFFGDKDKGPCSKRQKLEDPARVLEDQFLAQHPGPCTIRVCVPNGQLVEITVQSLSENVASLKERVAAEVQIAANDHKLSGKGGALEDDRSLAHYNVGAGEVLKLSVRTWCDMKRLEGNASSSSAP